MLIQKVADPLKKVTDPVLLSALVKQGIDSEYVKFTQDYAPAVVDGKKVKGQSPYSKHYRDLKSGKRFAVFSGLPMVDADGNKNISGWNDNGSLKNPRYTEKNNLFKASVDGNKVIIQVKNDQPDGRKAGDKLTFNPQLFLDGLEVSPSNTDAVRLPVDPTNPNYTDNVLEWDYGICKRRLRLIEGKVLGSWVFAKKPIGTVRIKYNQTGDFRLRLGQFKISDDEEQITPDQCDELAKFQGGYPVTISDSATFYPATANLSSTVGTSTNAGGWAIGNPYNRYSFFANTKYWQFYSDGTNMVWKSSADGITWSAATNVRACSGGYMFGIAFDGTNFHYIYNQNAFGGDLFYRMGTANSDGTITWLAVEQTVLAVDDNHHTPDPAIKVDSNGYPWIAFSSTTIATWDTIAYVAKSSTKDGTWTHETVLFTSPYQFSTATYNNGAVPGAWCSVVPLTNGMMYALVQTDGDLTVGGAEKNKKGRLFDGSVWGAEETPVTSDHIVSSSMSLVPYGDDIHMTYGIWNTSPTNIDCYYTKRTYSTGLWSTPVLVRARTGTVMQSCLSIDNTGVLYNFWQNEPTANHVYFKKCIAGTWDTDPTDWFTSASAINDAILAVSDKLYNGYFLFNYCTGAASPFTLMFHALNPTYGISVDGRLAYAADPSDFGTLYAATDATQVDDNTDYLNTYIWSSNTNNKWANIWRAILLFDISALPPYAAITGIIASLYGYSTLGANFGSTLNWYSSNPASNIAVVAADFDQVGTTAFATAIAAADFNVGTPGNSTDWTFNAAGIAAAQTASDGDGILKLSFRENHDATNTPPAWEASKGGGCVPWSSDKGIGYKPKLVVTYLTEGYYIDVDWDNNGNFTGTYDDITADVKTVSYSRGKSDELGKAEVGQCSITLNNADGKYTPGYGGVISALLLPKRPIRVRAVLSGTIYNLFYGFIEEIIPHPHLSEQDCIITAVDGIDFLSRHDMATILYKDTGTGAIHTAILNDAGWSATMRTLDTGQDTVSYWYGHDVKARFAQEEIDDSEQGFSFISGNGYFNFEDRHHRSTATHQTSQGTFTNTMAQITYSLNPKNVYNIVKATVTPWALQAEAELWRLQETPSIPAGETLVWWGEASVISGSSSNSVFVDAWVTPASTTDYTANSLANGTGTDMTADIAITTTKFAKAIKLSIVNNGAVPAFITLLKARGTYYDDQTKVTRKAEDSTSQTAYQKRTLEIGGKYMDDADQAQDLVDYSVGKYKDPRAELSMSIINDGATNLAQLLSREISDRITVVNTKLGIDDDYFIDYMQHDISQSGKSHTATYRLADTINEDFWCLDYSALASTSSEGQTKLGY
uniref:Putative tail protein n=1 Tax=viral metagenome TaxID=1070528 RepID=A0A6M3IZN6_9ZZZZ